MGKYTDEDGDDYPIVVNAPKEKFATLNTFNNIYINNAVGTPIPLNQIAQMEFESSPTTIKHLDKKRYVVVTAHTDKGTLPNQITDYFMKNVNQIQMPKGYKVALAGEAESSKELFGSDFSTVIIATLFFSRSMFPPSPPIPKSQCLPALTCCCAQFLTKPRMSDVN